MTLPLRKNRQTTPRSTAATAVNRRAARTWAATLLAALVGAACVAETGHAAETAEPTRRGWTATGARAITAETPETTSETKSDPGQARRTPAKKKASAARGQQTAALQPVAKRAEPAAVRHAAEPVVVTQGRLTWRSKKLSQPARLPAEAAAAKPIASAQSRRQDYTGKQAFDPFASGDQFSDGSRVIQTKATETAHDPFTDPFAEVEAAAASTSAKRTRAKVIRAPSEDVEGVVEDTLQPEPPELDPSVLDEAEPAEMPRATSPDGKSAWDQLQGDTLAAGGDEPCPSPKDLKRIGEIDADITAPPPAVADSDIDLPQQCGLDGGVFQPRQWAVTTYTWKASGLCHKPLYFEEVALERYGHTWGPVIQPVVSSAHFFATVPLLPYKAGMNPPWECMYPLGHYRPGNCAPYMIDPIPFSLRGGLMQAGAVVGAVHLLP